MSDEHSERKRYAPMILAMRAVIRLARENGWTVEDAASFMVKRQDDLGIENDDEEARDGK